MPGQPPPGAPPGRRFFVEFDAATPCPLDFLDNPDIVMFFIAWAFSIRFGGMHELAQAALHLERRYKVDLKPLIRYADRDVDDEADRRELERAWQAPAPVAAACRAVAAAVEGDDLQLAAWLAEYATLAPRLRELAAMCDWGVAQQARVRLSFLL